MAINKATRAVLKALSYGEIHVNSSRVFANIKALDPMKPFYKTIDTKIYNGEHEVPIRIYMRRGCLSNERNEQQYPAGSFIYTWGWLDYRNG